MKRRRRKEKHEEREKVLKKILSNAEEVKKIGDTRIEYKRDVNHKKNQKHFRKSRVFFFEIAKK